MLLKPCRAADFYPPLFLSCIFSGLLLAYDEVNYPQHSPTQQPQPSTLPDPDRLQRER